ncbi:hypothetical protein Tco_1320679 [Tanacetum coccineum]
MAPMPRSMVYDSRVECMSTRSSLNEIVSPFSNPERAFRNRQRNHRDSSNSFEMNPFILNGPPGPIPQNQDNGPPGPNLQAHVPDLRTMEELCQPTMLGRGGDDANKHIDKFVTVTQDMKQNGVPRDILRLCLFLYSLTHHATAWFDQLPKNSIHS